MLSPPTACAAFPIGVVCSMPPLLGNTHTKSKALPKIFQECPINGMENKNHMGVKLEQEAKRLGLKPAGTKAPGKQRALPSDAGFALLFELILGTGLRLSEAYSLRVDQVDLARWVLNVEGSKGHRGAARPRMVPLVRCLRVPLQAWCRGRVGRVFDFWDGTPADKTRCTLRLSARFATLFAYAGVPDFTEHDLRHCATCDWVTMRDAAGRWVFSEVEVCKIMGWTDTRMMLRYASLRGEDLAARLG